jgi:hypothetical protein
MRCAKDELAAEDSLVDARLRAGTLPAWKSILLFSGGTTSASRNTSCVRSCVRPIWPSAAAIKEGGADAGTLAWVLESFPPSSSEPLELREFRKSLAKELREIEFERAANG